MNGSRLRSNALLTLAAMIWGFAFSAQRSGMESMGPFAFNAARFALGALSVLPLLLISFKRRGAGPAARPRQAKGRKAAYAAISGAVLFLAISFQQTGLVSTTAGNAGFITCLYVVLVPVAGLAYGRRAGLLIWIGAVLALIGLYILSVHEGFTMTKGDLLVLASAFFCAAHILVIDRFGRVMDGLELALGQSLVCSALSLAAAIAFEPRPFAGLAAAAVPVLYGGIMSTGVAFTLQIYAQRTAHPAHASIIMSMESLFAAIGGIMILGEPLTARLAAGGLLMFAGTVVSQLRTTAAPCIPKAPAG